jgi:hypothetical protein
MHMPWFFRPNLQSRFHLAGATFEARRTQLAYLLPSFRDGKVNTQLPDRMDRGAYHKPHRHHRSL